MELLSKFAIINFGMQLTMYFEEPSNNKQSNIISFKN